MDRDIFAADVAPGGPTTPTEIKALICSLLADAGRAVSFEQIHEALREHDLVNYFELSDALSRLCATGHVRQALGEDETALYENTELGTNAISELSAALPAAAREKASRSIRRVLLREKRLSEVRAEITPHDGGWLLSMSLPDDGMELVSFTVFAPNRRECEKLRRNFLNDPVFIYKGVMALLSGRRDILGEPEAEWPKLF